MDSKQMIDELLAIPDVRDAEAWLQRKLAEAKREGMEDAARVIDEAVKLVRLRMKELL